MRARSSAVILLAAILLPVTAGADPGHTRGFTLGLTAVQPLPPWTDAGFGLAPWAGFAAPAWGKWNVTARAGWIGHFDEQQSVGNGPTESIRYKNWELPLLVGFEYSGRAAQSLLFSGEVGYVLRSTRAEYAHEPATSSTDHGAGVAIGGGYRISNFQLRVQWFMLGLPDPVKHKAVMFGLQSLVPI